MSTHTHPSSVSTTVYPARTAGRCNGRSPLARPANTKVPTFLSNPAASPKGYLGFSSRIRKALS